MQRRTFLLCIASLPTLALAKAPTCCPICGGQLVSVGELADDTSLPSKNLDVWNRSYHGDPSWPFFQNESPVCSRCYIAYTGFSNKWTKSNESADAFFVPLAQAVASFPLPPIALITSRVVYSQEFAGIEASGGRQEAVGMWFRNSPTALDAMHLHAESNNLALTTDTSPSNPGETCVSATSPRVAFEPAPVRC